MILCNIYIAPNRIWISQEQQYYYTYFCKNKTNASNGRQLLCQTNFNRVARSVTSKESTPTIYNSQTPETIIKFEEIKTKNKCPYCGLNPHTSPGLYIIHSHRGCKPIRDANVQFMSQHPGDKKDHDDDHDDLDISGPNSTGDFGAGSNSNNSNNSSSSNSGYMGNSGNRCDDAQSITESMQYQYEYHQQQCIDNQIINDDEIIEYDMAEFEENNDAYITELEFNQIRQQQQQIGQQILNIDFLDCEPQPTQNTSTPPSSVPPPTGNIRPPTWNTNDEGNIPPPTGNIRPPTGNIMSKEDFRFKIAQCINDLSEFAVPKNIVQKKAFKEMIVWIMLFHEQYPDAEIHLPNRRECMQALIAQYHTVKQGVCECLQHSFTNQMMNDETTKMRTCMFYFSLKLSEIFSNSQRNLKFVKYFQFPNTYLIFPNEI
ncbi:MAG: hypothetical protein GY755_22380 [Chloroflexi bacterium]|nr:hypothetical protein [Chloroflexota bacterium]